MRCSLTSYRHNIFAIDPAWVTPKGLNSADTLLLTLLILASNALTSVHCVTGRAATRHRLSASTARLTHPVPALAWGSNPPLARGRSPLPFFAPLAHLSLVRAPR